MEKKDFTIKNGKLFYNNVELCDDRNNKSFEKYEILEILGKGANGITILVKHILLETNQVIKIFSPNIAKHKALGEIKKNSVTRLALTNAINYDAGYINYPFKTYYSVMESIENSVSLKEWLKNRDYFEKTIPDNDDYSMLKNFVYCQSLNMSVSFLKNVILKNNSQIVHGDLNCNNILTTNSFSTPEIINSNMILFPHYHLNFFNQERKKNKIIEGTLSEIVNRFIDMGTSENINTTKEIGKNREFWFIFDNVRKILKPFFVDSVVSFRTLFNFQVDTDKRYIVNNNHAKINNYVKLTDELVRLVLFLNYIFGLVSNQDAEEIDLFYGNPLYQDGRILNIYMFEDFTELLEKDLCDPALVHALSTRAEPENSTSFIKWDKVWEFVSKKFPLYKFSKYNINYNTLSLKMIQNK